MLLSGTKDLGDMLSAFVAIYIPREHRYNLPILLTGISRNTEKQYNSALESGMHRD